MSTLTTLERVQSNNAIVATGERFVIFTNTYGKVNLADVLTRKITARGYLRDRLKCGDAVPGKAHLVCPEFNPLCVLHRRLPLLSQIFDVKGLTLPTRTCVLSSETHQADLNLTPDMKSTILHCLNRDFTNNRGTSNAIWCVYLARSNYNSLKELFTGDLVFGYNEFEAYDFLNKLETRMREWKSIINTQERLEEALVITHALFLKTLDEFFDSHGLSYPAREGIAVGGSSGVGFLGILAVDLQSELYVIGHTELYQKYVRRLEAKSTRQT